LAFWIRGFGSGSHLDNQVSRAFDQTIGGFQVGADKRFPTGWGDIYLGGFSGYFYASRDFLDSSGDGHTNAFSVGGYTTLIHPSGFYADLVIKNTWLWNHFSVPTSGEVNPFSSADYSDETVGGSIEIGKRWDVGKLFLEPQGQLAGAWADSESYSASNGLTVRGSSQGSLRGRLGLRAGLHLKSWHIAFEPFAGVFVINEFLGGDRVTTDQTNFFPTLSGAAVDVTAGLNARITDSLFIYCQYEYENADKFRMPWAVNTGLRWQW
jgi:outer membrane autotransporter protein